MFEQKAHHKILFVLALGFAFSPIFFGITYHLISTRQTSEPVKTAGDVLAAFSTNGIGPVVEIDVGDSPIFEDGAGADAYQGNHDIEIVDASGNMFAAWVDAADNHLFVQKLDTDGTHLWGSPVEISESVQYMSSSKTLCTKIFPDNADGATIIYTTTTNDIRAFRLDTNGNNLWGGTIEVMTYDTQTVDYMIDVASDNTGGLFIFERYSTSYVYQYLQNNGTFYSTPQTIDTTTGTSSSAGGILDLQYDGSCTYFAYSKYLSSFTHYFYIQKYCLNVRQWVNPILITNQGRALATSETILMPDGSGGVIAVYEEADNNNLLAQHYNSGGTSVWTPTIVNIQNQVFDFYNPYLHSNSSWSYDNKMFLDGTGNLVIVWAGEKDFEVMEFYMQTINVNTGVLGYPNNGKVLMDKYDYNGEMEAHYDVVPWGTDGFAIVIDDRGRPYLERRVAIHKFDMTGEGYWNQIFEYPVAYNLGYRDLEEISKVAGIYNDRLCLSLLVDTLAGGTAPDIYYVRITDGTIAPPVPPSVPTPTDPPIDIWLYGKKLVDGDWFQATHEMKYVDDDGNFMTAWADDDTSLMYVQKYNINGDPLWPTPFVHDDDTTGYFPEFDPHIIPDGDGGAMIVYEQGWADGVSAFGVDTNGVRKWPAVSGTSISNGSYGLGEYVKVVPDEIGGIHIMRSDDNALPYIIYYQHMDKDGNFTYPSDIPIYSSATANDIFVDSLYYDNTTGCVFGGIYEYDSTDDYLYLQKVCGGIPQWTMNGGKGVEVTTLLYNDGATNNSELYAVGDGGVIAFWSDWGSTSAIIAQRYDTSGVPIWDPTGVNIQNKTGYDDDLNPSLYQTNGRGNDRILLKVQDPVTSEDELIIVWTDDGLDWITTYMQRIKISDGSLLLAENGLPILYSGDYQDPGYYGFPDLFLWDDTSFIVVSDYATSPDWPVDTESFLIGRFDFNGNRLWNIDHFPEVGFTDWSHKTKVAGVFEGTYAKYFALEVVASDAGDDNDLDIYYMRLSESTATVSCNTYTSTDVPVAISDVGTVTVQSTLEVPTAGAITDLNIVDLRGNHTYISDLDFDLTSPAATTVNVIDETCASEENFYLSLDDEASSAIWPCPPIDMGTYRPQNPLYTFDGEDAQGTWTLTITDNWDADGGSLEGWGLEVCQVASATTTTTTISTTTTSSSTSSTTSAGSTSGTTTPSTSTVQSTTIESGSSTSTEETTTELVTSIPSTASSTLKTTSNVITPPETGVNLPETNFIMGPIFGIIPLIGMILTTSQVLQFPNLFGANILMALPYYIRKKVHKPWGIILDKVTSRPVPFAVVRAYIGTTLIEESVSDLEGKYAIAVKPGEYKIEIKHSDYDTFTKEIQIGLKQISLDIFLAKNNDLSKARELPKDYKKHLSVINKLLYCIGFVITIFVTIQYTTLANLLVLLVYIVFGVIFVYKHFLRKTFNISVTDELGTPVMNAITRFIDHEDNTLEIALTNAQGLYAYGKNKSKIANISVYKPGMEMTGSNVYNNETFGKAIEVQQEAFLNNELNVTLRRI